MGRLAVLVVVLSLLRLDLTLAAFSSTTASPANDLSTGTGTWFAATATGTLVCAGTNAALTCPFGLQPGAGKVTATIALRNKTAATTYTLSVVDVSGPAGISTIVTATFASNGGASVTLAAAAADTIDVVLKTKGSTPAGTYMGFVVLADSTTGSSARIPILVTH